MREMSVKEYAEQEGYRQRSTINAQIRKNQLPEGVQVKRVGKAYIIVDNRPK